MVDFLRSTSWPRSFRNSNQYICAATVPTKIHLPHHAGCRPFLRVPVQECQNCGRGNLPRSRQPTRQYMSRVMRFDYRQGLSSNHHNDSLPISSKFLLVSLELIVLVPVCGRDSRHRLMAFYPPATCGIAPVGPGHAR